MKKIFLLVACMIAICCTANEFTPRKKVILHSWDLRMPLPELLRYQEQLEQMPLDGISIFFHHRTPDGRRINFSTLMSAECWKEADIEPLVAPLQKLSSGKLRDNFLFTKLHAAKRQDWKDDSFWEGAANNFRIMAKLARRASLRGLIVDPEDYQKNNQYNWHSSDGTYAETAQLARKRGRRIGEAIAGEYPDAVLLFFWFFSLNPELCRGETDAAAAGSLWIPFANGILDVVTPSMRLVDGNENAYRYDAETGDFSQAALEIHRAGNYLAAPENLLKYRNQVQAGAGLYLDSYVNPEKSSWYHPPLQGSRVRRFAGNLESALAASDEYVWLCGEKHDIIAKEPDTKFLPWNYQKQRPATTWENELPGFNNAIAEARDGSAAALRLLEQADSRQLPDLARNAAWTTWQGKESKGSFFQNDKNGNWQGVSDCIRGSYLIRIPVKPGCRYAFRLRGSGTGRAWVAVRWKNGNRWTREIADRLYPFQFPNAESWQTVNGIIRAPYGVDSMVIMPGVSQEPSQQNRFADLEVFEEP